MATKKAKQPYQYEPLVTPSSWRDDEQRFSIRLTQIIDDLYQKYSALRQKTKNVEPSTPTDEPVDADTLNGKTADDFLAADGTAVDAEKLGGKAPKYYLPTHNLLVNSYFVNPVNQRGFVSGTSGDSGLSIDRWYLQYDTALHLLDGCIGLSRYWDICQIVPANLRAGETYTFAVLAKGETGNETLKLEINTTDAQLSQMHFYNIGTDWQIYAITCTPSKNMEIATVLVRVGINTGIEQPTKTLIKWAALYEDEYTAETLPPYVPKGYAAELLACNIAETGRVHDSDKLGGVPAGGYATKEELPAGVQMDLLWEKQGSGIQVGSSFPLAGDITNYDFIVMVSNHYKVGHRAFWFKPVVNSTVAVSAFGIANDTVTQMFVNEFVLSKTSVTYSKKRGINISGSIQTFDNIGDLLSTIYGVKGLLK